MRWIIGWRGFKLAALVFLALPQAARAAEIILYDFYDFGGAFITLTQSAPDLDQFNFDNDLESFRIVSGTWSIHRDDNFQNGNGPPLILGPGAYPNIDQLGFPQDRASSVRLIEDSAATPNCPQPYQVVGNNGQCVFACAEGTVGNPATGECVCANAGLVETGTDASGRRICTPRAAQVPETGPVIDVEPPQLEAFWIQANGVQINDGAYQTDDRNVLLSAVFTTSPNLDSVPIEYRAAEGPLTYDDNQKLQILSGAEWATFRPLQTNLQGSPKPFRLGSGGGDKYVYFQLRAKVPGTADSWIQSPPYLDTIVYLPTGNTNVVHTISASDAFGVAKAAGFTFNIDNMGVNTTQCGIQSVGTRLVFSVSYGGLRGPGQLILPGQCLFSLFGGRQLTPGWSFGQAPPITPFQCPSGSARYSNFESPTAPAYRVWVYAAFNELRNPAEDCSQYRWAIENVLLVGPAGADWRTAFQ